MVCVAMKCGVGDPHSRPGGTANSPIDSYLALRRTTPFFDLPRQDRVGTVDSILHSHRHMSTMNNKKRAVGQS